MWEYFLANYNKLAFILLGCLVVFKILLTVIFHKDYERNVVGIVSSIFRWYSGVAIDMADTGTQRFVMRLQNLVSIVIYAIAVILIFVQLLTV